MTRERAAMAGMHRYATWSQFAGERPTAGYLLHRLRTLAWRPALTLLARMAATIANNGGALSRSGIAITYGAIAQYPPRNPGEAALVEMAQTVLRSPGRTPSPIAHDAVLYFLEAAILLDSPETGRTPSLAELSLLMLMANDLIERPPANESPDPLASLAGNLCQLRRFNVQHDSAREFARAALLFERAPRERLDESEWRSFQRQAFNGLTFAEFFDQFIAPVSMVSTTWGGSTDETAIEPLIPYKTWFSNTGADQDQGRTYLASLMMSREEAMAGIGRQPDGLPARLVGLYYRPLIKLDDATAVGLSPQLLTEQLRAGIWNRYREAAKNTSGTSRWLRDFGLIFELWTREIAERTAQNASILRRQLVLSREPGTEDEIEDVVLVDPKCALLVSVKGALMSEVAAHTGYSADTMAWFDRFLFQPENRSDKRDHPGAVRKLERKIRSIRAGEWGRIAPDAQIIPMIVTFDNICDNPALYMWIRRRCSEERLLMDGRTDPLCLATVDDFEGLMALAADGSNVVTLMRNKPVLEWRDRNLDALLVAHAKTRLGLRLPFLSEAFERVALRSQRRLFPGATPTHHQASSPDLAADAPPPEISPADSV